MQLSEDENIEKNAEHCGHCKRKTLSPYENEWTCFSCGYNVIKRKHELFEIQRKKINIINRLKYAEQKSFCICIDVYKINEGDDYDKMYDALLTLKYKKSKTSNVLFENNKNMLENPDFEQDRYSRTIIGIHKIGHDTIRLMKWLAFYDRSSYENIYYHDMMGSVLKSSNEVS